MIDLILWGVATAGFLSFLTVHMRRSCHSAFYSVEALLVGLTAFTLGVGLGRALALALFSWVLK